MSNSEENPAIEPNAGFVPAQPVTVVPNHEGEDAMGLRSMTVERYEEIRRRLADGRGVREIARALGCARATVREVRDGSRGSPNVVVTDRHKGAGDDRRNGASFSEENGHPFRG